MNKLALFSLLALAAIIYASPAKADPIPRRIFVGLDNDCPNRPALESGLSQRFAGLSGIQIVDRANADNAFYITEISLIDEGILKGYALCVVYTNCLTSIDDFKKSILAVYPANSTAGFDATLNRLVANINLWLQSPAATEPGSITSLPKIPAPFLPSPKATPTITPDFSELPDFTNPKVKQAVKDMFDTIFPSPTPN